MYLIPIATLMIFILATHTEMLHAQADTKAESGGIQGIVLAPDGSLMSGARVVAEPDDTIPSGKIRSALTDEHGMFLIEDLRPGTYVVPAAKEQDGYPNTDFAAFAVDASALPRVSVFSGRITRGVIARLDPKGGRLVGTIRNATTRQPVLTARITLTRIDRRELFVSTGPDINGHFEFVLPSRPFDIEITATGYLTWRQSGSLLLESNSTRTLDVLMNKDPR